jgi:hypothetical protein
MEKRRPGLHKEISMIFDGVPIPKGKGAQQPPDAPKPAYPNYGPTKAPAPAPKPPSPPPQAHTTYSPQKPQTQPENQKTINTKTTQSKPKPAKVGASAKKRHEKTLHNIGQNPLQRIFEQIKKRFLTPPPGVSPSRQITTVVSIPVLFIILVLLMGKNFIKPSASKANLNDTSLENTSAPAKEKINWKIPEPYSADLRDPMKFGPVTQEKTQQMGGLIIKGIVYSTDNPCAVIGNQIVHTGETIFGATIVKIHADSVEFESNGERWTQKVQR